MQTRSLLIPQQCLIVRCCRTRLATTGGSAPPSCCALKILFKTNNKDKNLVPLKMYLPSSKPGCGPLQDLIYVYRVMSYLDPAVLTQV